MASFPSGVAIVTTVDPDGTPRGLTTTAVSSVSAHPPTILVCVDLGSRTLSALRGRRRFVVNFVGRGRSPLGLLFASKADDKFERVAWRPTESGIPLLHVILVARVEDGGALPENEPPLMYYRRSWGVWSPVHEASEPEPVEIAAMEVSGRDLRWQGAEF